MTAVFAGYISSTLFIGSTFPMLTKALRTRDMRSYSRASLAISALGNAVHWLYVASLPLGPIYLLHGFTTIATVVMLVYAVRYGGRCE